VAEGIEELIRYRARGHPSWMRNGEMVSRMSSEDDEANGREDEEEDDDDEPDEETDDE